MCFRFSEQVIEERRKAILAMLEYIANYPELFTTDIFVKFFEVSQGFIKVSDQSVLR